MEILYTATEGRYVDLLLSEGTRTRSVRVDLQPFTLIGATTEEGELPTPLLTRFDHRIEIEPLETSTMKALLEYEASRRQADIDPAALVLLTGASLGIPRQGLNLVRQAIRTAQALTNVTQTHEDQASRQRERPTWVTLEDAHSALDASGLDERGLCRVQRKILEVLERHGKPMGLAHLATHVGKAKDAILKIYEPDLVRAGYVERTPTGRKIGQTSSAWRAAFEFSPPPMVREAVTMYVA